MLVVVQVVCVSPAAVAIVRLGRVRARVACRRFAFLASRSRHVWCRADSLTRQRRCRVACRIIVNSSDTASSIFNIRFVAEGERRPPEGDVALSRAVAAGSTNLITALSLSPRRSHDTRVITHVYQEELADLTEGSGADGFRRAAEHSRANAAAHELLAELGDDAATDRLSAPRGSRS